MRKRWLQLAQKLPTEPGLLLFKDAAQLLFVALSPNLATELERWRAKQPVFWAELEGQTGTLETFTAATAAELVRHYAELLRTTAPPFNYSLKDESDYPHFKLTRNEAFSRLLVTRRVRADGAKYYGPFLPDSGVRRLLDLLNRLFKLRSCEVEIDGSWPQPCAEYYAQRCLGPCVAALCNSAEYQQAVRAVDQVLAGNLPALILRLEQDIATASNALDFEAAAAASKLRETLTPLLTDTRWDLRVDKVNDVWVYQSAAAPTAWQLETVRAGKILGEKTFSLKAMSNATDPVSVLAQLLAQWYGAYWPQQIFVPIEFAERPLLDEAFTQRAGHKVQILVAAQAALPPKLKLAAQQATLNLQAHQLSQQSAASALPELQQAFALAALPQRIEAYDVAHLAGQSVVAAQAVALNGKLATGKSNIFVSVETSEIAALSAALKERLLTNANLPDLILLDGGRAQLNAVSHMLSEIGHAALPLVAVVKPLRQRNQIAYLLNAARPDEHLQLPTTSAGWRLIQQVRDEAHRLANEAHRKLREATQLAESALSLPGLSEKQRRLLLLNFGSAKRIAEASRTELTNYLGEEMAAILHTRLQQPVQSLSALSTLLVPVRLDDPFGDAADLRPIRATDQEGKLLTERTTNKKGRGPSRSNPFALKRGHKSGDEHGEG
jgi:excinuclease ABC subunit C